MNGNETVYIPPRKNVGSRVVRNRRAHDGYIVPHFGEVSCN
jgi:hypothetical protein